MKTISKIVYLLAVALLLPSAPAATMVRAWVKSCDGPAKGSDNAFAIAVDAKGDVFVAGQMAGTVGSPYAYDYVTIKYASSGVGLWTNRFHGPGTGSDQAKALALDASGDVIVTGQSSGLSTRTDFATIKYSGQGLPLWTNRYRAPADSAIATAVGVDTNGDVVVTGYTYASGLVTIKYSRLGLPLWTNRYIGPVNLNHYAGAIALDGSGKVFVSGFSTGSGTGDDFVTLAYSSAGVPLWTNRYNGPDSGDDQANGLALDGDGNVFVTGGAVAGGLTEFVTIKYQRRGTGVDQPLPEHRRQHVWRCEQCGGGWERQRVRGGGRGGQRHLRRFRDDQILERWPSFVDQSLRGCLRRRGQRRGGGPQRQCVRDRIPD